MSNPPPLPPPSPLDYHVPRRPDHAAIRYFAGQAAIWTLVAVVLTVLAFFAIPRFEQVFKDFKVSLPLATVLVYKFFGWLRMGGILVFWVLPVAIPFILSRIIPADESGRPTGRAMALLRTVTFLSLLLCVILGLYAVFGPMLTLIDAVSGPAKR